MSPKKKVSWKNEAHKGPLVETREIPSVGAGRPIPPRRQYVDTHGRRLRLARQFLDRSDKHHLLSEIAPNEATRMEHTRIAANHVALAARLLLPPRPKVPK